MIDHNNIINQDSAAFVDELVRKFRGELRALRAQRAKFREDSRGLRAYVEMPHAAGMRDPLWRVKVCPTDLIDRRVEITGPAVDPKMAITALNSGAQGYMIDAEDSLSPTWENVLRTQSTVSGAVRRTLKVDVGGREHVMNVRTAVMHYRPRGLHLDEFHWIVDSDTAPASLVDFGLFAWWNARELLDRGTGPYVYLPKLETELEAGFWDRVFSWVEDRLVISPGSIRCTVLVETVPALLRLEDIVWALRERLTGLNVGRWDYMLSLIRSTWDGDGVLPDRGSITMDSPALSEYARWVVRVAHRRGCHAIGGMAAAVPSRKDVVAAERAIAAVRSDKEREVTLGHDGTWVAHPDLVGVAREVFDRGMSGGTDQRWNVPPGGELDVETLLEVPAGGVSEDGIREAIRTSLVYVDAWLGGNGCVAIAGKMEDAATAEIARALLWQWVSRGVEVGGVRMDASKVDWLIRGEVAALAAAGAEPRQDTVKLLVDSIFTKRLPDHILNAAYEVLVNRT